MNSWYESLQRPALTPPGWVFGPVWTVLYSMIAVSLFLFIGKVRGDNGYGMYGVIALHLVLNFCWTWLFFGLRRPGLALIDIVLLDVTLIFLVVRFWPVQRISSILLWPYLVWVLFATWLNAGFYVLNRR
ncbi:tryptophan-rich sensory protein [bacterium]|nr:tryptophan-rich sensory protein [bacterium]